MYKPSIIILLSVRKISFTNSCMRRSYSETRFIYELISIIIQYISILTSCLRIIGSESVARLRSFHRRLTISKRRKTCRLVDLVLYLRPKFLAHLSICCSACRDGLLDLTHICTYWPSIVWPADAAFEDQLHCLKLAHDLKTRSL